MAFEIERKFLVSGDAWRGLAGPMTVVVYKTQVWYMKMPGKVPEMP